MPNFNCIYSPDILCKLAGHSYTTVTTHLIRILKEQLILFLLTSIQNSNCLYFVMSIEIRLLLNTKSIAAFIVVSSICSGCKKMVEG